MRRRFINNFTDNYFTIVALEDGLIVSFYGSLEYRVDNGEWILLPEGNPTPAINSGQKMQFRGTIIPSQHGIGNFSISKRCNLKGNVMSILFGDNAANITSLVDYNYAFSGLFKNCTTIQDASELLVPATKLAQGCYINMFSGCTSLVSAPELPATTLVHGCYIKMFSGCTSLTTAPKLPATTLAGNCYANMFSGCTSLTTAPKLPATTLAGNCYANMFSGCSKLNYIKMLATNILASGCLTNWLNGVASSGTFVKNKNASWNATGSSGIPYGWTVKTE